MSKREDIAYKEKLEKSRAASAAHEKFVAFMMDRLCIPDRKVYAEILEKTDASRIANLVGQYEALAA